MHERVAHRNSPAASTIFRLCLADFAAQEMPRDRRPQLSNFSVDNSPVIYELSGWTPEPTAPKCDMSRLSSRSFIKLHALFQFALAAYLTWSPEVITDSGLVYYVQDELKIFDIPPFSRPRSPFALCGILLLIFALVDLTLAIKLPALNRILTIAHCIRRDAAAAAARQPRTEGQLAGSRTPA
ncbi:hypothetical protein CIHG_06434 [Coccidioides immitis H538.4]|uniref:Uncharacterized protein n=1 Tax=Coccidioides immitis H538.4 TaxID=396776 RepID=A0A0J8RW07_COCIT|nr:hypothetical protein CIHG_06434 [Coccidioides immitis H538.4]